MTVPLGALHHRNFALFMGGQISGLIGYWIQQIALNWLVYRLTGSATLLGVLALASNLPVLVLAPFAGLWSDRFNRHRAMFITQVVEMLQAIVLAALAFSSLLAVWHIVALSMMLGVCVAVELPVRHAYLLELVGNRRDVPNAVAVMSLILNCGRLVGPVIAGLLIARFSEATCFLINALSYIPALITFAFIRVKPRPRQQSHSPMLDGLTEGLRYAWHAIPIRFLLALLVVVALTVAPYLSLMPAVVHEAYAGNAEILGFLVGAAGLGAICGTLLLAARRDVAGLLPFIAVAALTAACALMALSWSRLLPLSLAMMALIGFSVLVVSVSSNMILQAIVEDDKRGRVMSLYTAAFLGVTPFGSLAAGALADQIGATNTLLGGGSACLLATLWMSQRMRFVQRHLAPLHARAGADTR
jgi:MFS family permease